MHDYIKISMNSAKKKIVDDATSKFCFELLGYDFMIDSFGQLFLIEVNVNPSLEESCNYLKILIPRMISKFSFSSKR